MLIYLDAAPQTYRAIAILFSQSQLLHVHTMASFTYGVRGARAYVVG